MIIIVYKLLKEKEFSFNISIFGIGPLKESLNKQIKELNLEEYVKLEGFCGDIYPVLKSMDLFILTSINEGLPMSLLEAMAIGTPVLSTAVGGIKEVIEDGETGLLVPSKAIDEFEEALIRLYQNKDLRNSLASQAKEHVNKQYNIESNNKKLFKLYRELQIT